MVASHYVQWWSKVRCTLLDMSKAFDMVDHGHLFDLLLQRKLPYPVLRFLIQWYSQQCFLIRWSGTLSTSFTVANGVRQGGILPPILRSLYTLTSLCSNCRVLASVVTEKNCLLVAYAMQMISLYFPSHKSKRDEQDKIDIGAPLAFWSAENKTITFLTSST